MNKITVKIAISNIRGGAGKTTTTICLAGELGKRGYRVLIVDADIQGNSSLNLNRKNKRDLGTYDLMMLNVEAHKLIKRTEIENVDIIPNNSKYYESKEEDALKIALQEVEGLYDFILFDCSPTDDVTLSNVFIASDYIISPIQPEIFSLDAYDSVLDKIGETNPDLKVLGILPVRCNMRLNLHKSVLGQLRNDSRLKNILFSVHIRETITVQESQFAKTAVCFYSPKATASQDYETFTDEVLKRIVNLN